MSENRCLAVIPAKEVSKRLPGKNRRKISGKTLTQIAVEQAVASNLFDDIVVSTDSQEILELGMSLGASEFPLRPGHLCEDSATSFEVVRHAVETLGVGSQTDYIYTLPPTSPFRTAQHIREAHALLQSRPGATGVLSCVKVPHRFAVEKQMVSSANGFLVGIDSGLPVTFDTVSVPQRLGRNSAIYGVKSGHLNEGLAGSKPIAFMMPELESVDIDTEQDLALARALALALFLWKEG